MSETIIEKLMGFDVAADGSGASVRYTTTDGTASSMWLTPDTLRQLLMTLPRIISMVIRARHDDPALRLVFPLSDWRLETTHCDEQLILTLVTADGFDVAFSIRGEDLAAMLVTAKCRRETISDDEKLLN